MVIAITIKLIMMIFIIIMMIMITVIKNNLYTKVLLSMITATTGIRNFP